ncbi:hypothetical protein HUT18_15400 [Streptomyces sp. NA04227]|uniref:SCO4225 family membrane protein n=1 Tax=Streptomyces sp. NA04227 TaxID=2742136 RepID=UPI001591B916|nr:hypothetical protein [Streptomyces sp. NA04227]QKW07557.1 hypothetical protein HUT18_15400 [Streptomyces sp. NA04227]
MRKPRILTAAWDSWLARGYLLVVGASVAFASYDTHLVEHEDASLAWVWPIFTTVPVSLPALTVVPESVLPPPEVFFTACGYVIATGLGLLTRRFRDRAPQPRLNWNS